ncbi:hypothetical protein DYU11_31375 [Fibrisoma montanum]|uniref:Uncharacterized protein n=1 Tax=Fibrisoma montanum TaxID=2305895 RepID=A0A418LW98_9BACT|nr:hypothetical protein [Fibrisoma montanum]RIV17550.1 hypothetical protein DYU11_31375 [Fibrisoma montanum]
MKSVFISFVWLMWLSDSTTLIDPGKQFVVGGNNNGAFTISLRNVGNVPVELAERQSDGKVIALDTLRPAGQRTLTYKPGSAALFTNSGKEMAVLKLTLSGDIMLNMRYTN